MARLLRNPVDFGNALRPFYGERIAADIVKAAKADDNAAAAAAERRWYANADAIAALLGRINPYWSEEQWRIMLHQHLTLVKAEAVDMLTGKYAEAVAVYDQIEVQSLGMADVMAEGILRQFNIQ